jgi:hypothetical protein
MRWLVIQKLQITRRPVERTTSGEGAKMRPHILAAVKLINTNTSMRQLTLCIIAMLLASISSATADDQQDFNQQTEGGKHGVSAECSCALGPGS